MNLDECKDQIAKEYSFYVKIRGSKAVDDLCELYATSKVDDYKSRLREEVQKRIDELENDENEFSDEEVFFALRECKKFLELIDTILP